MCLLPRRAEDGYADGDMLEDHNALSFLTGGYGSSVDIRNKALSNMRLWEQQIKGGIIAVILAIVSLIFKENPPPDQPCKLCTGHRRGWGWGWGISTSKEEPGLQLL